MTITYPTATHADAVSLSLDKGSLIDLKPPESGVRIEVQTGNLWVTQEGDQADHLLGPGESYTVAGRTLVVVQALLCSAFRIAVVN